MNLRIAAEGYILYSVLKIHILLNSSITSLMILGHIIDEKYSFLHNLRKIKLFNPLRHYIY